MKILVVQPTADKRGHYGIYTAKVCQALGRRGLDVTLCTNRIVTSRYLAEEPAFRVYEVAGGRLGFERFDAALEQSPLRYYWGYFRNSYAVTSAAIRLSRREPFDAVVILDAEFMTASLLLLRHRAIPPVIMFLWATNFTFGAYSGSLFKRAYKVVQRGVFRRALGPRVRALAVLDEWHRDGLRGQLALAPDFPIAIIPDGADPSPEMPPRAAARRMLELPDGTPLFLFFGVLRRDKGIESLLEAASLLKRLQEFRLVLAGWPMEYTAEQIVGLVDRWGLRDRAILRLGYVADADVPAYFAAADVLVLPYAKMYTGGSGPITKGACTYRRPVIATRVSGMGDLVAHHGIGLVAEPDNPRSLAEKMGEFLALPENERETMVGNAARMATANSWDTLACRLEALARQICARA